MGEQTGRQGQKKERRRTGRRRKCDCANTDLGVGQELFAPLRLLRVVEPLDLDHHLPAPALPQRFDAANVRAVISSGRHEHGGVPNLK